MTRLYLMLLPVLGLAVAGWEAQAQTWPTRLIRAIVPLTAGSNTDIFARVVLDQLSPQLGQSIVLENRTGAGRIIGAACEGSEQGDRPPLSKPLESQHQTGARQ